MKILIGAAVLLLGVGQTVLGLEGRRADAILLNGQWEFALGTGDEQVQALQDQAELQWRSVSLPGRFVQWDEHAATSIRFVWVRRTFNVPKSQADRLAVLRWNRIDYGATAFINDQEVGHNEPTGPYHVILPNDALKPGENEIVLKIPGAAGVRRSKSGQFMFPAGLIWGPSRPRMPSVTDDVWIDFADKAYMKWVLAIPDLASSRVRIRATPIGIERLDDLKIVAEVRPWPEGAVIGSGVTDARCVPSRDPLGGERFQMDIPMPDFKPWTPRDCNLYTAEVKLMRGEDVLDVVNVRFGMREIKVVGGDYKLNGRTLWLRGSNLVHEWDWADIITGKEKAYLVTEAKEMSMNAFRTHTQPPPKLWADVCDEHGTMILAEFPVLYNYRNHRYTPEEWEIFHRNALTDTAGWMARLWNHPSVVMWVLSNESRNDNEWEAGPFRDFVVDLDPTRPTMRTGTTGTKTNYDVHTCGNTNHWTHEGQMHTVIDGWFQQAGDRTVTNSEYMNIFNRPQCQWTGNDDVLADRLAYAQLGMEHTEVMRRARVDAILPYMYAGWTRTRRGEVWKAGYAQPVSACWHSALSPVLASLDLFDANYLTSQRVTTDVYLINDSWDDVEIHVDVLLTKECPEFIPEAECFEEPLAKWSFDHSIEADTLRKTSVTWTLPDNERAYWLTARTTGIAGRPVLSQRFVRAVTPPEVPDSVKDRTFVVLGGDATSTAYFRSKGLTISASLDDPSPREHVVLVWNPAHLSKGERQSADRLCRFAAAGGRVVVMSAEAWNWNELCNVRIGRTGGSRVFAYEGVTHPLLRGVDPAYLKRWNGVPGTVAVACIEGPAVEASKKILWVREPKHTVVAEVVAATGDGSVLFSQLDLRRHVLPSKSNYDPVADRILLNILTRRSAVDQ